MEEHCFLRSEPERINVCINTCPKCGATYNPMFHLHICPNLFDEVFSMTSFVKKLEIEELRRRLRELECRLEKREGSSNPYTIRIG